MDGLIPSLQTGKVDVVISSMTITEERKEVVDFSIPYSRSYLALLVNQNSGITRVADLDQEGMVIDIKKGTIGSVYAKKHLTKATVNALSSENASVKEVLQGKADAFIYDQLTIYRQYQANKDITDIVQIPAQDSEYWGIDNRYIGRIIILSIFEGAYISEIIRGGSKVSIITNMKLLRL